MIWAMLIGGIIVFFFASGDALVRPEVLHERIEIHVADEERRERAGERVDAFEEILEGLVEEQSETVDALGEELEKLNASREAIEKLLDTSDGAKLKAVEGLATLREELKTKKILTAEEWPKVFSIEGAKKSD